MRAVPANASNGEEGTEVGDRGRFKGCGVVLICVSFTWTGCAKQGASAGDTKRPPALAGEDRARLDKLQPVIHCVNDTFPHYESLIPAYRKFVAAVAVAPKGAESVTPPSEVNFKVQPTEQDGEMSRQCADGLTAAVKHSPANPAIDDPARDASAALLALQEPSRTMASYLQQKTYLNDGFAKGRELNAVIEPLFERVSVDDRKLRAAVDSEQSYLDQRRLSAIEAAEGRSLTWHTEQAMGAARALDQQVSEMARSGALEASAVAAAAQPLQTALAEAQTYLASHPDAAKPDGRQARPMWFSVADILANEVGAANALSHALEDKSLKGIPLRVQVFNNASKVNADYNAAVSTYNVLRQNRITSD